MFKKVFGSLVVLSLVIGGGAVLQTMDGNSNKEVVQTEKTKVKSLTPSKTKANEPAQELLD